MKGFKKVILYIVVGLGIGSVVSTAGLVLMGNLDGTLRQVIAWLCASACYGLISLVYETEKLSLRLVQAIHLLGCLGVTLFTGWRLGYFAAWGWTAAASMVVSFLVIYTLVSVGIYLVDHRSARIMSEKLK